MKRIHPVVFIITLLFVSPGVRSQNSDIDNIIRAGQEIKNLFRKKKNRKDSVNLPQNGAGQIDIPDLGRAGEISPTAKVLDVDEMLYFNQGAAYVRKGTSTALIDNVGDFIVPFNKYRISKEGVKPRDFPAAGYHNGIFIATEIGSGKQGLLNSKGSFYPVPDLGSAYMCGPYVAFNNTNQTYTYIDNEWHVYTMAKPFLNFREGVGASYTGNVNTPALKYGYKKITGQYVIAPQYDFAGEFWQGRAVIGKINEYGEMKYGFIDMTGHEIFPCVLSIQPGHFSGGLARIEPKDKTEFDYGFINRQGNVVIKLRNTDGFFKQFFCGYAMWQSVLDSTGKIVTAANFLNRYGISNFDYFFIPEEDVNSLQLCDDIVPEKFYYTGWNESKNRFCATFFDVYSKKKVKPVFEVIKVQKNLQFDRVARLAYAKTMIGKDNEHYEADIYREGFINEKGEYVIVKKQGSMW